jgi:predicted Zn-ribbon and HTH transcriptional regulator
MNVCKICGYEWKPRTKTKACPRCKRYDWNKSIVLIKKKEVEQ